MKLYSTNNKEHIVDLKEAVLKGLPPDNGLYMPTDIPELPQQFIQNLDQYSFPEIAFTVSKALFQGFVPEKDLKEIIQNSITFPAPIVKLNEHLNVLELFHGPSLAFKDFGARFMAQLMSFFNKGASRELVILVATSGDTGGAVAAGFYDTPGIQVIILYPSGKVSHLQEKQLTTLGKNISALEVDGTFDDCQALVKKAFLDLNLGDKIRLSSANSINIARLIPQTFYYFESFKQINSTGKKVIYCVPSGNFGNLTAGLIAQKMGLPIDHFIAATNINDVVPEYIQSGIFAPRPSMRTISNAMDVGNPSNFARMLDIYRSEIEECSTWNNLTDSISGYAYTDKETISAIREIKREYGYVIDPHGAVGYLAAKEYLSNNSDSNVVILETAHPSKFIDTMKEALEEAIQIPDRLSVLSEKKKVATPMSTNYLDFKTWLLANY